MPPPLSADRLLEKVVGSEEPPRIGENARIGLAPERLDADDLEGQTAVVMPLEMGEELRLGLTGTDDQDLARVLELPGELVEERLGVGVVPRIGARMMLHLG